MDFKSFFSSSREIKGKVLNATDNKPIQGAVIVVPGTPNATISNEKGEFSIKIKSDVKQLHVKSNGMEEQTVNVESLMMISLEPVKVDDTPTKTDTDPQDDIAKTTIATTAKPELDTDTLPEPIKEEDEPKDDKPTDDKPEADGDTKADDKPAEQNPADTDTVKSDEDTPTPVAEPKQEEEEPEPVIDTEKPEIRFTTSINDKENGMVVGISIQGRSHITHGIPCQDYHAYESIAQGWHLAITSDGAGSAREAARGSKANCDIAVKMIKQLISSKKWVENNYFPTELEWYIEIRNILENMQVIIEMNAERQAATYKTNLEKELAECEEALKSAKSDRKKAKLQAKISEIKNNIEKPLEARDFNATIIILLLTPQGMLTAHIGDGRMGYLSQDGKWKALLTPHKGDEASATVFVPNNWNRQRCIPTFTMSGAYLPEVHAIKELPKAYVLMSDGCEDFTWHCYAHDKENDRYYDPNLPYDKFFNPLIDAMKEAEDNEKRVADLIDIINTVGKHEQDDRTILFGILD